MSNAQKRKIMSNLYFNNRRYVCYSKISDIFHVLPSVILYMERERIADAEALVICLHWFCFQCGIFIRRKSKKRFL